MSCYCGLIGGVVNGYFIGKKTPLALDPQSILERGEECSYIGVARVPLPWRKPVLHQMIPFLFLLPAAICWTSVDDPAR
jgi:hypothetical protein